MLPATAHGNRALTPPPFPSCDDAAPRPLRRPIAIPRYGDAPIDVPALIRVAGGLPADEMEALDQQGRGSFPAIGKGKKKGAGLKVDTRAPGA